MNKQYIIGSAVKKYSPKNNWDEFSLVMFMLRSIYIPLCLRSPAWIVSKYSRNLSRFPFMVDPNTVVEEVEFCSRDLLFKNQYNIMLPYGATHGQVGEEILRRFLPEIKKTQIIENDPMALPKVKFYGFSYLVSPSSLEIVEEDCVDGLTFTADEFPELI